MNKPVLSPEDIKKAYALKTKVLYLIFLAVPTLAYLAYTIEKHEIVDRVFPDKDQIVENREKVEKLVNENARLQKQLTSKDELIALYKKKTSRINVDDRMFTLTFPVLQSRYISWETFRKRKGNVKFSAYREKQVEFLHSELDKAKTFLDTLTTLR